MNLAPVTSASIRQAPLRLALLKFAPERTAPRKLARERLERLKLAPKRFCPAKQHPPRSFRGPGVQFPREQQPLASATTGEDGCRLSLLFALRSALFRFLPLGRRRWARRSVFRSRVAAVAGSKRIEPATLVSSAQRARRRDVAAENARVNASNRVGSTIYLLPAASQGRRHLVPHILLSALRQNLNPTCCDLVNMARSDCGVGVTERGVGAS